MILLKEGAFMSENKLLDLFFEFAAAIVDLVDGVTAPKSSCMTDRLQEPTHLLVRTFTRHNTHKVKRILLQS